MDGNGSGVRARIRTAWNTALLSGHKPLPTGFIQFLGTLDDEGDTLGHLRSFPKLAMFADRLPISRDRRTIAQARSTSNAARLRASRLNSTPTSQIGWPEARYLSA